MKFTDMKLKEDTVKALQTMFGSDAAATEIQQQSIPVALEGGNVIAQARTGSGKTLAFSIPIIERLEYKNKPEAVILVPTRELCKQVGDVFASLGKYTRGVQLVEVYGGVSIQNQMRKIDRGVNVVVATPGRLIDLYERRAINFSDIKFVVLDEADRMLDMGFMPDVQYILSKIDNHPQFLLFSATIIDEIKQLSNKFTGGVYSDINVSEDSMTVENTKQFYYLIQHFSDKYYHFVRIFKKERAKKSLIFTNTKKTADWLKSRLDRERGLNLKLGILSGNMSQAARERVIDQYKQQRIDCLIATDVAARGLDIPDVTHVFNYDVPQYEENYVHRIGRTSRMGKDGVAITLCLESEYIYLCRIEGFIDKSIKKLELPPRNSNPRNRNQNYRNNRNRNYNNNNNGNKRYQKGNGSYKGNNSRSNRGGNNGGFVNPFK